MDINIPANVYLKDHLESLGYMFPCGGKGLCGRCKIEAPLLDPTKLDYRFLTKEQIGAGIRLACDKYVEKEMNIECDLQLKPTHKKPEEPCAYAIFNDDFTEIGLLDDGIIIDSVSLKAPEVSGISLRAQFNSNVIELFEKYDIAKAVTIVFIGTSQRIQAITDMPLPIPFGEMYDATEFQLPGENLYIPALPISDIASSDIIELLDTPEETLVISKNSFFFVGSDIMCVTIGDNPKDSMPDNIHNTPYIDSDFKRAYKATLEFLIHKFKPKDIITFTDSPVAMEYGARLVERRARYLVSELTVSNRKKATLNKIAKRCVTMSLADSDEWQSFFSNVKD
ncbi:MAG TPA: hypothetical protein PKX91_05220 [Clostridia bacterium]|jgi:ferredoxin|nr:hypothetical protein [Clostridia bacterium]